jgi:DNA-binding MarR family transcriptional regulator
MAGLNATGAWALVLPDRDPYVPTNPRNAMHETTLTLENRIATVRAKRVLDIFRTLNVNNDMPIGEAIAFLQIAMGEKADGSGISVTELARETDYSLAAASRYAQHLGELDRKREPGLKLITDHIAPTERRRKVLRLTSRGRTVLTNIICAVGSAERMDGDPPARRPVQIA